jgi:hypothetical protein
MGGMLRRLPIAALLLVSPILALAYDGGMPNLLSPSSLEPRSVELRFEHRSYGPVGVDPLGTAFGTAGGANVAIEATVAPWRGLAVGLGYVSGPRQEYLFATYTLPVGFLRALAGAEIATFDADAGGRGWGGVFTLSVATKPLFGMVTPTVLVDFDTQNVSFGAGLGLSVMAGVALGAVEKIGATAELYPNLDLRLGSAGGAPLPAPAVSFGAVAETPGHQFTILLGNTNEFGTRVLARGAAGDGWYLGFNIRRQLAF